MALAMVLAALVVAGAIAAGAVMAAGQAMRDAAGAVARAGAMARAERALTLATTPAEWDSAWSAAGAPGLVAVRAHAGGGITHTVLIVRLAPGSFLLLVESRAAGPPALAARARLSLFVQLDSAQHAVRAASHSWTPMP